ncbi:MAG: SWIM zinc finger family protein, partial [Dactylosporangium sp.]|nr:SWIM zinc finger family protein [Dactylosporangium sp.]NNJ62590.1 SWIM zinc finger family protein [Dactylosporangium sp.]
AWDGEASDERAAMLAVLADGLSPADEPLLERALGDRRSGIRALAADLLVELPGSGYTQRMIELATACIDVGGTGIIRVRPPSACTRAMRRDGITARPPAGVGARTWLLEEVLAHTPLQIWPGPPGAFLERPMAEGWRIVVQRGLARAAASTRNPDWAEALITALAPYTRSGRRPDDRLLLEALYEALPPERLAGLAATALPEGLTRASTIGVERMLELCPRPWPEPLTDAVLTTIAAAAPARTAGWRVTGLCETAALRLPPESAPHVESIAETVRAERASDPIVTIVQRLLSTLRYRNQMLREFA